MIEFRLRSKISQQELEQKKGKILTDEDYNVLLTRACRVLKPDGKPLAIYLPASVLHLMDDSYPTLSKIRMRSDNRGLASGTKRVNAGGNRSRAMPIMSGVMGAMDPAPNKNHCRLTAFTRNHIEEWEGLQPLLEGIANEFQKNVPERYAKQMEYVDQTQEDWVVEGTPFTTITINNSYSTGVHTDKGDLAEGFSCLAVGRRGDFSGGRICFPEYRVAVDLKHGDLVLMDAHEWHGNTAMFCSCGIRLAEGPCEICGAERISVVCYYRERMFQCASMSEEQDKREQQMAAKVGVL